MSEYPEWVERQIGWAAMTPEDGRDVHRRVKAGEFPDPRGRGRRPAIWWRRWWPFDRRCPTEKSIGM